MKKCVNCGGNNSDFEIYCDWCGEKLLPEKKMTLILFLKYYFQIFAILGVIGAIIYYISTFLVHQEDSEFLKMTFLGIELSLVLKFGLFICFCLFILLLILLIIEIAQIQKTDLSIKFLMFILLFLLLFTLFLFFTVGSTWLHSIVFIIVTTMVFVIYYHILDIFFFLEKDIVKKSRNLLIISSISLILFGIMMIFNKQISDIINYLGQFSLLFEDKPLVSIEVSDGIFTGVLLGITLGSMMCGILLIAKGLIDFLRGVSDYLRKHRDT